MRKAITLLIPFFLLTFSSCQRDFFKIVSSSYAKEFCSCLYIEQLDPKTCENYATQILKIDRYYHDPDKRMIVAEGFGFTSSSYYRSERLGCSLP